MASLKKHGTEIARFQKTDRRASGDESYDAVTTMTLTDKGVILRKVDFKNHSDGARPHSTGWKVAKTGCDTNVERIAANLKKNMGFDQIPHRDNGHEVACHKFFLQHAR